MTQKVFWKDHNFYYNYDLTEKIYDTDYFQFFNGNAKTGVTVDPVRVKLNMTIKKVGENQIMVEGPFYDGYYALINGKIYPYQEEVKATIPLEPVVPALPAPTGILELTETDGRITLPMLPKEFETDYKKIKVVIDYFTNEVYPDYPFKTEKKEIQLNKFYETEIMTMQKNVIYQIKIYDEPNIYFKEFKAPILSYFSNVKSLKQFVKDLQINITLGSDEEIKKLIQEKSVQLKRRFGLYEFYTEDPEYFPIFKRVVNLYCVEDLISISFANGNFISGGAPGGSSAGANLTLSKLKIDDTSGTNSTILSTDVIKSLIEDAEADLYSSIFKKPYLKKAKGCFRKCYQL